MITEDERAVADRKKAWLLPYLQGWAWKLDDCCSGRHIHRRAQIRTIITCWLGIIQRPECTLEQLHRIEIEVPSVIGRARSIYREDLAIREAKWPKRAA